MGIETGNTKRLNYSGMTVDFTGASVLGLDFLASPYTFATLPSSASDGTIARISDRNRGLYVKNGGKWVSMNFGWYNVADFGADPTGVADSFPAFQAAADAATANGGSIVYAPDGRYLLSDTPNLGNNKDFVGAGDQLTILDVQNAKYALKSGTSRCGFANFRIESTSGLAIGGIDLTSNHGPFHVRNVWMESLTAAGAICLNLVDCLRGTIAECWFNNCQIGYHIDGGSTLYSYGNVFYLMKTAAMESANNEIDLLSVRDIIESCNCSPVVNFVKGGLIKFEETHFEDNCSGKNNPIEVYAGRSGADEKYLFDHCNFGPLNASSTGVRYDIQCAGDLYDLTLRNNVFLSKASESRKFYYAIGATRITRIANTFISTVVSADLLQSSYIAKDASYGSFPVIMNDVFRGAAGSANLINKTAPVARNAAQAVSSGTGETDLFSYLVHAGDMGRDGQLVLRAAGQKTGAGGNKTIKFYIGATAFTIFTPANDALNWYCEVTIMIANADTSQQRLIINASNGGTWTTVYGTAAINSLADMTLKFTGQCANAGDTVTQEMFIVQLL